MHVVGARSGSICSEILGVIRGERRSLGSLEGQMKEQIWSDTYTFSCRIGFSKSMGEHNETGNRRTKGVIELMQVGVARYSDCCITCEQSVPAHRAGG